METTSLPTGERTIRRVSLDHAPKDVKRFFKTLSLSPEGSVYEMNGKPLVRMLPATSRSTAWSDEKSARRCELIERDLAETITSDESLELELLQEELQRHVERVAPLPLEYARKLQKRLLAKAEVHDSP